MPPSRRAAGILLSGSSLLKAPAGATSRLPSHGEAAAHATIASRA